MEYYLYGASVQGIQSFIFQTNKLKEIVGASQLVDNICTIKFEKFCKKQGHTVKPDNIIMSAAGKIKYVVDEESCKNIVQAFPKFVSNYAPGVSISQAVVKLTDDYKADSDLLDQKLSAQRNQPAMPVDTGLMGLERARRTGGVGFKRITQKEKIEVIDRATYEKVEQKALDLFKKFKGSEVKKANVPFEMEEITNQSDNAWIAIIHADGNGLGQLVEELTSQVSKGHRKEALKTFSQKLEIATREAAMSAFAEVIEPAWQKAKEKNDKSRYPFRPVVLGGDDLTVIIRADLAFDFTTAYLKAFEVKTKEHFKFLKEPKFNVSGYEKGITACAGIAYIKEAYPFHYGVHLAEDLTKEAKNFSKKEVPINNRKNIPASSLSFYKVQSSFTQNLKDMKKQTLFAEESGIRFDYGPYLIHSVSNFPHIAELTSALDVLKKYAKDDAKGVSKLRQWITELYKDTSKAKFMINRMATVNNQLYNELGLKEEREKTKTLLYELIQLHSFKNS